MNMGKLRPVATTILGNEKAMGLEEIHEQAPDNSGFRRYQLIFVVRNGKVAEFRKDLGPAKNFKGKNQLNIPSLMEYSVDELMDIADYLREDKPAIDIKDWLELENYKPA